MPAYQLNTEKEQATALRCSVRHLMNLRYRKMIPYIVLGRAIRYNPEAVARALEKLTVREVQ